MEILHNTLKKLTKVRPLRPSVMFSTPPVASKLCDCNWFFIFARDCRHRTQIPLIFWEKELIYTFLPYTSSLTKLLCMWQKNNTSPGKSTTNPKLMTHSVVNLVTSQYSTFLSFFPRISVNISIRAFPTTLISFDRSPSPVLNKFWERRKCWVNASVFRGKNICKNPIRHENNFAVKLGYGVCDSRRVTCVKWEAIRMFILTYNENKLEGRQFLQDHDSL